MFLDTGALRVLVGLPVGALAAEMRGDRYAMNGFTENLVMLELLRSGVEKMFYWSLATAWKSRSSSKPRTASGPYR